MTQVIENCKFGKTPKGVCLEPNCGEPRSHLDTTGYCRIHKIARGIPVSAAYKTLEERRERLAVAPTPVSPGQVLVDTSFLVMVWETLTTANRGQALEAAWPQLRLETRVEILTAYMKLRRAVIE